MLQRNRAFEVGQIHFGSSTTLCKHIMLPLLQTFVEKNPHIRVTIDGLSSRETALQLAANKMDVGLLVETSASKSLAFTPLTDNGSNSGCDRSTKFNTRCHTCNTSNATNGNTIAAN